MTIPRFSAQIALRDHGISSNDILNGGGDAGRTIRQTFPIGSCMARCAPDDFECLFDCLAPERGPFRSYPGGY